MQRKIKIKLIIGIFFPLFFVTANNRYNRFSKVDNNSSFTPTIVFQTKNKRNLHKCIEIHLIVKNPYK